MIECEVGAGRAGAGPGAGGAGVAGVAGSAAGPVSLVRRVRVEDLAGLLPGPQLGAALAGLDRRVLNGYALVDVLVAQARQVAHEQARFLADVVEVAHCLPGDDDSPPGRGSVGEFAADEIRVALCVTRRSAETTLADALDLVERLPQVHAALLDGSIDLPKARVFSAETLHVGDDLAVRVVGELLGVAPVLTTGQLAARLRRRVLKADPGQAKQRAERSVQGRRVFGQLDPDGTSSLGGVRLPADRAAAAMARIGELARARTCTGDPRTPPSTSYVRTPTSTYSSESSPTAAPTPQTPKAPLTPRAPRAPQASLRPASLLLASLVLASPVLAVQSRSARLWPAEPRSVRFWAGFGCFSGGGASACVVGNPDGSVRGSRGTRRLGPGHRRHRPEDRSQPAPVPLDHQRPQPHRQPHPPRPGPTPPHRSRRRIRPRQRPHLQSPRLPSPSNPHRP